MAKEGEAVHERGGGQPNVAQTPANADGRVVVGAGAPEEPVDESTVFNQEVADLEREMGELANNPDRSAYWDAATRREMVRFLQWASQTDSTVFFLGNTASPFTDRLSESLDSDTPVATNAAQYNEIREGLERIRNTSDNSLADNLLNAPIPGWNQLGKLARRLAIKRAILARLRRKAQERVLRRRRRRRDRRDCRLAGNPAFMPSGIPVHYDPDVSIPTLLKIAVTSTYYGNVDTVGPLGRGWLSDLDATIRRNEEGGFTFLDEDGFSTVFTAPTPIPDGWEEGDTIRNSSLMQGDRRALIFREDAMTTHFDKCKDGLWRITRIEDRRGNTLRFGRDTTGNLLSVETPDGLKLHFSYSANLRTQVISKGSMEAARPSCAIDRTAASKWCSPNAPSGNAMNLLMTSKDVCRRSSATAGFTRNSSMMARDGEQGPGAIRANPRCSNMTRKIKSRHINRVPTPGAPSSSVTTIMETSRGK
ncbi:DUF6531 domain-containing protein [Rhizobium sp. Leaf371]|uniref:DUF6531 domain-containing protein n=1 Tax=Rhizobium sp. Leaf371 TaxID=1736355 RepID=UPI0009EAAED9|nr:DUF6531 domain-containing protein [Rhizobium sp. Leaf371]